MKLILSFFLNSYCLQTTEMEHQAITDPFIGSIETATAPSSATFDSYSRFQHPFQQEVVEQEQQQSDSSVRFLQQEQEEVLTFQQKKVFWESRTSGESSPTGSESQEKISPQKKEHFETFVKPSLDDTNTEAEDLEYKAIPSEKLDTPIDQDKMITRQIRDGIVDMELEQGDEPVMTDSWIENRSSTSSAPQLEPETPEEEPREAAAVAKRPGIKFVDVDEDKPRPEDAQRAAERLVESIKMKAVIIAEEIRRSPYEQQESVEPDTPSSPDNNHIEMARELATDFISAMTSKAVELAERITPMMPKEEQHVQFEAEEESEELETNEIITYHATSAGSSEADVPRDFRFQASFRAHFVRHLDEHPVEDGARGHRDQARVHLVEESDDEEEEEPAEKSQQFSSDKQNGESRKYESRDDDHFTSDDINEDIWAEQSKVTYRKKMFGSSTSSSIKKTSDTESSSKIGDRRSGTDFESSSCDNFMTARDGTPGLSRPSSSDVEILLSAVSHRSSDLTADYETAQTSHHDASFRSNATTSGEYHTAVSSLMSEESLKSIDESSGNLGSIEISDVKSDTLKDAAIEFDRESLNTPIGPPHDEEVVPNIHLPGSVLLEGTPDSDTEDSSFVSHMVRSAEMIFYPEPHTLKELMGQQDEEVDQEPEFEPEEADQVDFKNLSESRETLSASILTISSTSEVTILQPQIEAPELKVHEASDEDKRMFQLSESSSSSTSVSASEKAMQSVTPQTGSCDFLSSVEELKKDDSPIPATRPTPLPRVVSFETSVFFESSRMREQKSFDSEFGSRPESELKELESRPHSISESVLSRSSSEDQRPMSKEDMSDSEMTNLLRVTEPFARPHTPEPPEKVFIKNTVVFSEDALQEADIAFSQHFTGVLDELSEEAQIVPEVEIMTAVELDEGSDLLVGSPPMVSRPLGVKYWPPSDELNLEDDGAGPMEKRQILRSESEDYPGDDYPRTDQEREIEEKKRWLESQFDEEHGSEGDGFQFVYSQPLDQIMEEEDEHDSVDDVTERELRKLKESLSSTPDFDNIHIRRHIALRGDKDDVSMSSLQEFERLEREVALRGSGSESRGSLGSQDSLEVMAASNGRNHVNNKTAAKSCAGDDISVDSHCSLQEFEKMEAACREAESIEQKAKEQEDVLSEIEEGHESQISESDSCETLSEAGKSDNSDDYEQRMFQIDEIIKQAQCNVERFEEKQKKERMEQSAEMLPLEEILGGGWTDVKTESSVVDKTASVDTGDSDSLEGDPVPDLPDEFSNVMQTSVDSLDLKMKIMQTSADSLDLRGGQMTISTDSIEPEATKPGIMTESVDSLDGGGAVARGAKSSVSPPETSSNVYLSGAAALITSTDSLESCSTRATASMLSSMTSNTSADLEFDNRAQFRSDAKKFYLSQGEIPIEDSDESSCSNVVMTKSSSTTMTLTSRVVIAEKSKLSKDAAAAITTTFDVEKFDSSCEETYEETDEYGNRKHIVIKRSIEQPFAEKTEIVGDAVDVVAQRRLNQGLGVVSQAIFRDL